MTLVPSRILLKRTEEVADLSVLQRQHETSRVGACKAARHRLGTNCDRPAQLVAEEERVIEPMGEQLNCRLVCERG